MSDSDSMLPITVGIDLGTSSVKVVAVTEDGNLIAEGTSAFETLSQIPGQAEQYPQDWLRAASAAMRGLETAIRDKSGASFADRVTAVGLTGQLPSLVCLGAAGPIAPSITWRDGRADTWTSERVDEPRRSAMYACTGMPIDGRYLAPMLQFHFSDRLGELSRILSAKDYLLSQLTGLEMTEPSTAAGFGVYDLHDRSFSETLCDFWGLPSRILPDIRPANSLAGPLTKDGAALLGLPVGLPVSTGAADSVCAGFALAGLDDHSVSISFGSSTVIVGASREVRLDSQSRFLLTPHVADGWYGREMDLLATGTGYRWLSDLLGWADGQIDTEAAHSIPGANGLVFPPYLAGGEQGALWNPRLHAALFGIGLTHTRSDIARAYLEGVFYEVRRCIEVLSETTPIDTVQVSGNIAASQTSLQMLADILQRPIGTSSHRSPAAYGAALLARMIVKGSAAPMASPQELRSTTPAATPRSQTAHVYSALYQQFLALSALCDY
jgi:xylulokinase